MKKNFGWVENRDGQRADIVVDTASMKTSTTVSVVTRQVAGLGLFAGGLALGNKGFDLIPDKTKWKCMDKKSKTKTVLKVGGCILGGLAMNFLAGVAIGATDTILYMAGAESYEQAHDNALKDIGCLHEKDPGTGNAGDFSNNV